MTQIYSQCLCDSVRIYKISPARLTDPGLAAIMQSNLISNRGARLISTPVGDRAVAKDRKKGILAETVGPRTGTASWDAVEQAADSYMERCRGAIDSKGFLSSGFRHCSLHLLKAGQISLWC